jgi:hypothetical protein
MNGSIIIIAMVYMYFSRSKLILLAAMRSCVDKDVKSGDHGKETIV